jgi:hypothetical protein
MATTFGPRRATKNLAPWTARSIELVSKTMPPLLGNLTRPRMMGRFSTGTSSYRAASFSAAASA